MIRNERQYRIAKAEADKFRRTLAGLTTGVAPQPGIHPRLAQAEREALQSQLDDLLDEIKEYEDLKSGKVSVIRLDSFDRLPEGLIRARIASGLSQKALAERLGMKEQQIQRYEAEGYTSASLQRLSEVANAIGLKIREEIELPTQEASFDMLFRRLREAGVDRDFVVKRIVPRPIAAQIETGDFEADAALLLQEAAASVERVFGWSPGELFGTAPLAPSRRAAESARFKVPARRVRNAVEAYATYARYLVTVVIAAVEDLPREAVPLEPRSLRQGVLTRYGTLTLDSVTNYCWDVGVPVLPLHDRGTFHGACWRYGGRNVIVLKQHSPHVSRWLFDLIHELFHAGQRPEADELEVMEAEETSAERRNSEEEIAASRFAGDVVLHGRAEELAQACVARTGGDVRFLKRAVSEVAAKEQVSVSQLANYLAYRLSWQGINWWGAAANLQENADEPWRIVREVFLRRFPFGRTSEPDRRLLQQALA